MKNFTLKLRRCGLVLTAIVFINIATPAYINGKCMEDYSTQKKMLLVLPIVAALIGGGILLARSKKVSVKKLVARHIVTGANTIQQNERQYLRKIINDLSTYTNKIDRMITAFLGLQDKRSYAQHVAGFNQELDYITNTILASLHKTLATRSNHSCTSYTAIVQKAHDILALLRNNLASLLNVLETHERTKKLFPLVGDLKRLEGKTQQQFRTIDNTINELYRLVIKYDATLAQQVNDLRSKLRVLINNNGGSLTGLRHRLNCK